MSRWDKEDLVLGPEGGWMRPVQIEEPRPRTLQEIDFEGLDGLPESTAGPVRQARIEARSIIDRLEPRHITGQPTLIEILEDVLAMARLNAKITRILGDEPLIRTRGPRNEPLIRERR